jgi:hypothetical protein
MAKEKDKGREQKQCKSAPHRKLRLYNKITPERRGTSEPGRIGFWPDAVAGF